METFKKRDDLLKVEKFTSPRKLEGGGAQGKMWWFQKKKQ